MKRKKNQDHLKFTLFPFVSILLATVGVLIFLTMVQSVLIKDEKEEEKPKEEHKRTYERIPEFNTHVLRFYSDKITLKKPGKKIIEFKVLDVRKIFIEIIKNCLQINYDRIGQEIDTREHLLYVVEESGAKSYFNLVSFLKKKLKAKRKPMDVVVFGIFPKSSADPSALNQYLPVGLVLLEKGEGFELK